jgi:hypothetical protein
MATYYVGAGGNNANDGLSWANRKLTPNGAEDIPVAAGDTVYVGPGVYRETLTCDVSGSAGSQISYIGDYDGSHTDGVGGVVRITGSDDDTTTTRNNCIVASGKTHRTFRGFALDLTSADIITASTPTDWIIANCAFMGAGGDCIDLSGVCTSNVIENCLFMYGKTADAAYAVNFNHSSGVDDSGNIISNCLFRRGYNRGIGSTRVGGITVKNNLFLCTYNGVRIGTALTAGQTITVNNNLFVGGGSTALQALSVGEITENYNAFWANQADRSNVNTGANSNTYPPLFDLRWFFEMVGGGSMLTPFDLGAWSQLINVAGTSPTTADMRGTTVQGAQREWGALEYDTALDIEAGVSGGGILLANKRGNKQ